MAKGQKRPWNTQSPAISTKESHQFSCKNSQWLDFSKLIKSHCGSLYLNVSTGCKMLLRCSYCSQIGLPRFEVTISYYSILRSVRCTLLSLMAMSTAFWPCGCWLGLSLFAFGGVWFYSVTSICCKHCFCSLVSLTFHVRI